MPELIPAEVDSEILGYIEKYSAIMNDYSLTIDDLRTGYATIAAEQGEPDNPVPSRDLMVPTRHGDMQARLYRPEQPAGLLLYIHGGGFILGDLDMHNVVLHALSRGANISILSVAYYLAPEHMYPIAYEQCVDALCWAASHRGELATETAPLGVAGDSAGGNLTSLTTRWAALNNGPSVSWQALINPVLDFVGVQEATKDSYVLYDGPILSLTAMQMFLQAYFVNQEDLVDAGPLRSTSDFSIYPPTFIAAGECDPLRDDSIEFDERLREAGVPSHVQVYAGMPHNFMSYTRFSRTARKFLSDFINAAQNWVR